MQRHLILNEWAPTDVSLTADEALGLQHSALQIGVSPLGGGRYRITPTHFVGSANVGDLATIVRPKVDIDRLFFLLGYSRKLAFDTSDAIDLDSRHYLTEAFVRAFLDEVQRALRRGPLMAYRSVDESANTLRGRLRIDDQVRRRFALPLPLEIRYDDFTVDVTENRVLRAALTRAGRLRVRDALLRRRIAAATGALEGVSDVSYSPRAVPAVAFTRLNRHYAGALALARAILASTSVELEHGTTTTPAFVVDMDKVFEDFVSTTLPDALETKWCTWRQGASRRLDVAGLVTIKPDLSLWRGERCVFVGDVKYKRTSQGENADLYQVLAYCKALGVRSGLLIYATTDGSGVEHEIRRDGTRIVVRSLDLRGTDAEILNGVGELASVVDDMASQRST